MTVLLALAAIASLIVSLVQFARRAEHESARDVSRRKLGFAASSGSLLLLFTQYAEQLASWGELRDQVVGWLPGTTIGTASLAPAVFVVALYAVFRLPTYRFTRLEGVRKRIESLDRLGVRDAATWSVLTAIGVLLLVICDAYGLPWWAELLVFAAAIAIYAGGVGRLVVVLADAVVDIAAVMWSLCRFVGSAAARLAHVIAREARALRGLMGRRIDALGDWLRSRFSSTRSAVDRATRRNMDVLRDEANQDDRT